MVSTYDYAALSAAVYSDGGVGEASNSGWIRIQNYSNSETGFFAALFENGAGEHVLAFRGTEPLLGNGDQPFQSKDTQTDLEVLRGRVPEQFADAIRVYREVAGMNDISVTGHSLGGGLASYVAAKNPSIEASVFNSLGIAKLVDPGSYANIRNYNNSADPVTLFGPRACSQ